MKGEDTMREHEGARETRDGAGKDDPLGRAAFRASAFYGAVVEQTPALKAGIVHCPKCGREARVDAAKCLAAGWPLCCGETMFLGPAEFNASATEPKATP